MSMHRFTSTFDTLRVIFTLALAFAGSTTKALDPITPPPPEIPYDAPFEMTYFQASWGSRDGSIVARRYTLRGPRDGGTLTAGYRVAADPVANVFYVAEWPQALRVSAAGDAEEITIGASSETGWPMGAAYDSKRDRITAVTLDGEGFMFAHSRTGGWSKVASLKNLDLDNLIYSANEDAFYGSEVFRGGHAFRLHKLSATGQQLQAWSFPIHSAPTDIYRYRTELARIGGDFALLVEPHHHQHGANLESRIYFLDVDTATATLTYRKVWATWPPVQDERPTVRITQPTDGQRFNLGEHVHLHALAKDLDGRIRSLEFFVNDHSAGFGFELLTFAPVDGQSFALTLTNLPAGTIRLRARATDDDGNVALSEEVAVIIIAGGGLNQPPTISLTQPTNGQSFMEPASLIHLIAAASDADGSVTSVDFFAGDRRLGQARRTRLDPKLFEFYWTNAPVGTHVIGAKATDDDGAVNIAQTATIHVKPRQPGNLGFDLTFFDRSFGAMTGKVSGAHYTQNGPLLGDRLFLGLPAIADGGHSFLYAVERQQVLRINRQTGQAVDLFAQAGAPETSWPVDITYDSRRNRLLVADLVGEGHLHAYNPATGAWQLLSDLNNIDLDALVYSEHHDALFGLEVSASQPPVVRLHRYSPEGVRVSALTLPTVPSDYRTRFELVSVDGSLVLLAEPDSSHTIMNQRSRIYVIDPEARTAKLTYERLWPHWPETPVDALTILSPTNNSNFALGHPIRFVARVKYAVSSPGVEFFANGSLLGRGSRLPTIDSPEGHYEFVWTNATPGPFSIVARARSLDARALESAPVKVTVQAPITNLIKIIEPLQGATFVDRDIIRIRALVQPNRHFHLGSVQFYANGSLLGAGQSTNFAGTLGTIVTFDWTNPPAGSHSLVAKVTLTNGQSGTSQPILITRAITRPPPQGLLSLRRLLPPAYSPGHPLPVSIAASPGLKTRAYAVEDRPPHGWVVTSVSHEGAFDPHTGKVKFGPFQDARARNLTYSVKPPATANGIHHFIGHGAADGKVVSIAGDTSVMNQVQRHPADAGPADNRITLVEVSAYAGLWQHNATTPLTYVTRAAHLWKRGEAYRFDPAAGPAPLWWVPSADAPQHALAALGGSANAANRSLVGPGADGSFQVTVTAQPTAGVEGYAIEEQVPAGWVASAASAGGTVSADGATVRWGPFFDATARTLAYRAAPTTTAENGAFTGIASFDGSSQFVEGAARPEALSFAINLSADGSLTISFPGAEGTAVLETTTSLDSGEWIPAGGTQAGADGVVSISAQPTDTQRFYRLRLE